MKHILNNIKFRLPALDQNVSICTAIVSNFSSLLNPTIEELGDIRISVGEAFKNAVQHAYKDLEEGKEGFVYIQVRLYDLREVTVEISDNGCGIEDVDSVLDRKSSFDFPGMGFMIMKNFMDTVIVKSKVGKGTTILMRKALRK